MQRQFLCICIYLVGLFYVSANTQEFNDARIRTLLPYIIASKAILLNSTCAEELQIFREAVNQKILWSLKVLDSSGNFKSGFLYGNNYWLGSRNQCLDTMNTIPLQISQRKILNNTLYRDPRKEFPPFQINYFVAQFRHNSTLQYHINTIYDEDVIMFGLCLPASCTTDNLSFILEEIFRDRAILINDFYSADFQLIQVKNLNDDNKRLPNGVLCFVCVSLGLSFLLIIIGTIYDIFVHQKRIKKNETGNGKENMSEEIQIKVNLSPHQESKIGKILICFSVYTNSRKIFNIKSDVETIPVIHGLKFLNMCCMILVHTAYFSMDNFDNKVWLWRFIESYGVYIVDIAILSADTYLLLSGCLVTCNYLRDKTNKNLIKPINYREKLIEFFSHIIKRFIRLTPTYMMVLGIYYLCSAWFEKTSPFYVSEKSHETCPKYWWRNLLYINNFFGLKAMCMSWSWYLACDMQFYVIAMMLLILSTIYFYAAVTILSVLLISSSILSGYISYVNEYVPTLDNQHKLTDVLYFPPWVRINPYIIGMIAGYILIKLNNNLVLKRKIIIFCWCLAVVCKVFVFFALYNRYLSVLVSSIYVALHKILWAISVAWIIIACSTKHGGIVDKLLSLKGWIPFSRLTYCAYLLNPVIIHSINLYSEKPIHFEFVPVFVMNIGITVLSFFHAYILSLIIEMPSISLMKIFIRSKRKEM